MFIKKLLTFFLLIFLLTSCNNKSIKDKPLDNSELIYINNSGKIVYYNPTDNTVINYFESTKKLPMVTEYDFDLRSNYYTSGSSIKNEFKLLNLKDNDVKVLYQDYDNGIIFITGYKDNKVYFVSSKAKYIKKEDYYKDEYTQISVFDTETKEVNVFENTKGENLLPGTLNGDYLYYTDYIEADDKLNLYKLDVSDLNNKPVLVEEGLSSSRLFFYKDSLLKINDDKLYVDENNYFDIHPNMYLDEKTGTLIKLYQGKNPNNSLRVIDIERMNVLYDIEDILSVTINENDVLNVLLSSGEKLMLDLKKQ
ncbi:MAG: hypothetical protein ACRCZK_02740 [Oscillospiraceae bacterium]